MNNSKFLLEVCVDCLESIRNAIEGGALRLELCSALSEGGLTPSLGLAKLAKEISPIPIFAMIRIRGGNFIYQQEEFDAMLEDVHILKSVGIDGFVFGALTADNDIETNYCRQIVQAANPLPVTFHRAFDQVADPISALEVLQSLNFSRLLTSGQRPSAEEGANLIAELINKAKEIIVMPGAGINQENILSVRDKTGAREFHGSAKKTKKVEGDGIMAGITITDVQIVRLMVQKLKESSSLSVML